MGTDFDSFSSTALHVLTLAQREASLLHRDCISTEHLLLALTRINSIVISDVLKSRNLNYDILRSAVVHGLYRSPNYLQELDTGVAPDAFEVVHRATEIVSRFNHDRVEPEHIFISLLEQADENLNLVLARAGVPANNLLTEIIIVLQK
jgi:ATP-dependent Clp protease ATP-binding subunit ClpC